MQSVKLTRQRGGGLLMAALTLTALAGKVAEAAPAPTPRLVWVSDPVRPDDTVLALGEDLGRVTSMRLARLPDGPATAPSAKAKIADGGWRNITPLQVTPRSIKFVIPADWKPGVYACRLITGARQSETVLINAPDPWWIQADQGQTGSPGGWMRVFGKSLNGGGVSQALLTAGDGTRTRLKASRSEGCALWFTLPAGLRTRKYAVLVQNGFGGGAAWTSAGDLEVKPRQVWPAHVFNVMDFYGADAEKEIERTLDKGSPAVDRTEAITAALKKAETNGGGVIYFPEGKYAVSGEIKVPPHTLLRGAGMGLVTLWWGKSGFALDGGSDERRLSAADALVPPTLISGTGFGLEDMSLYLPREYQTAISAGDDFRMRRVRIRVDRYWIRSGRREDGLTLRLGDNAQVTDCDILARGVAFTSGRNELLARNKVMAGKSPCALEHSDRVIVEDNDFVSLDPTAYINVSGEGRNVYYAHNRHTSLFVHQSDFSWTFDGGGAAYLGALASVRGADLTLAGDPAYPAWAPEGSALWGRAVVCILSGRGTGQYRFVRSNRGRDWQIDRPFQVAPDAQSVVSIFPFRGRLLMIGNHFEDAGWVNLGYGSSLDVICAGNSLYRVGAFLNLGLRSEDGVYPSWFVQYLDNDVYEGQTLIQTTGDQRNARLFPGSSTRAAIHRRQHLHADNSGRISVGGNATDVIVEHCTLENCRSRIEAEPDTAAVLFRDNTFATGSAAHYSGGGLGKAVILPDAP